VIKQLRSMDWITGLTRWEVKGTIGYKTKEGGKGLPRVHRRVTGWEREQMWCAALLRDKTKRETRKKLSAQKSRRVEKKKGNRIASAVPTLPCRCGMLKSLGKRSTSTGGSHIVSGKGLGNAKNRARRGATQPTKWGAFRLKGERAKGVNARYSR